MRDNTYIKLEGICKKYKGYVGTQKLREEGFSNRQIAFLTKEGYLEKICYGVYWLNGRGYDKPLDYKCIEVCLSAPRAVICMDSALYYQGAIEAEPGCLSVATERTDRSMLNMNFPVKRHYFSKSNFEIGLKKIETEYGGYFIYDIGRSACDIMRLESRDIAEIVSEIYKNEEQQKRLLKYAKLLRVKYIGVTVTE